MQKIAGTVVGLTLLVSACSGSSDLSSTPAPTTPATTAPAAALTTTSAPTTSTVKAPPVEDYVGSELTPDFPFPVPSYATDLKAGRTEGFVGPTYGANFHVDPSRLNEVKMVYIQVMADLGMEITDVEAGAIGVSDSATLTIQYVDRTTYWETIIAWTGR